MKKFTFMLMAAFVAVVAYAQLPAAKAIQKLQAPVGNTLQNVGKIDAPRALRADSRTGMRKAAEDFPVISEQPEGELKTYARGGNHYAVSGSSLTYGPQSGSIDIVFAADKKVYFKDIVSGLAIGTWVEGTLNEDGTQIVVPLGQNLFYNSDYDAAIALQVLAYNSGFAVDTETTEVVFTISEDGVISLQGTGFVSKSLAGVWTDDDYIQDYGDYESVYTEYTPNTTLVTLPEGLETVDMPLTGNYFASISDYSSDNAVPVEATVKVAWAESTVYIQGLVQLYPEAWVKGELNEDGEVEIPVTYLGQNDNGNVYVMGYSNTGVAPVALIYDASTGTLEVDGYLMLSSSDLENTIDAIYTALFVGEKPETVQVPENLEIVEMPVSGTIYDGSEEAATTATVKLGVDGDDVYVQGLVQEVPEGWIKGTFNEDKTQVVFPYGQYVGAGQYGSIYVVGDQETENEDGETEVSIADIVFSYDAQKNLYTLENNLYVSGKKDQIYYYSVWEAGTIIGEDVDAIWVAADQGYENAQDIATITIDENITGTLAKGEGSTSPKYYNSGTALRMYANNTLTIASAKPIAKIEFTLTGNAQQKSLSANVGEYALDGNIGTWTGEANEVVFTVPSTSGSQARIQKIKVWYFDFSTQLVTVPENLETAAYLFKGTDTYRGSESTFNVQVGFADDKVYIQGLSEVLPEAWVRGTLEDGKVTIPGWYLGTYETFFGNYEMVFSGAEFAYDAENHIFTSEEGYQTIADGTYAMDEFAGVTLTLITEVAATPADPSITQFNGTSLYPSVQFNIPLEDVDGNAMVTDKLSYVLWIEKDGVEQQLTLTTDLYTKIEEDMTEIPYDFSDSYDIFASRVYLNQPVDELKSWTKIGIQSIYRGLGEEHKSNIGWFDLAAYWIEVGINEVNSMANSQKAVIYNMAGQRVEKAQKGLYIINGKKVVVK